MPSADVGAVELLGDGDAIVETNLQGDSAQRPGRTKPGHLGSQHRVAADAPPETEERRATQKQKHAPPAAARGRRGSGRDPSRRGCRRCRTGPPPAAPAPADPCSTRIQGFRRSRTSRTTSENRGSFIQGKETEGGSVADLSPAADMSDAPVTRR